MSRKPFFQAVLASTAVLVLMTSVTSVIPVTGSRAMASSQEVRDSLPAGLVVPDGLPSIMEGTGVTEGTGGTGESSPLAPEVLMAFPNHPGWPVTVQGGASPPVCADLDPQFPGLEIAVGSLTTAGNLYVFHQDGSLMSGYPVDLGFFIAASPSIGDIDADGDLEIVVGDFGGNQVWALHADGTPLPGWPIPVGANVRSTAALADLDPSFPGLEIVVGVQDGTVQAWHHDGTSVPGWPVTAGTFVERCSPAIGDVDGDGDLEVFIGSWYDGAVGSTGGVYGFSQNGATLPGWPKLTNHVSVIASPALADLDDDGDKEIIVGTYETNGKIYVWHHDGTNLTGWPFTIPRGPSSTSLVSSSPAVGDIDGDGTLEIVTGSCGECGTVYAFHRDGTVVSGWPYHANCVVDGSSPVLGDVDGDGRIEIVIGSGSGFTPLGCTVGAPSQAYIFHGDGSLLPGWPVTLGTATIPGPALANVDGDADVEVVMAFAGTVFLWDAPGAYQANLTPWPYYHLGIDHTGDFAGRDPAAVEFDAVKFDAVERGLLARPNPWAGGEPIRFVRGAGAAESTAGSLRVFDVTGSCVRRLSGGSWDGKDEGGTRVPSGVYLVRSGRGPDGARVLILR